jgi:hypothetical protein
MERLTKRRKQKQKVISMAKMQNVAPAQHLQVAQQRLNAARKAALKHAMAQQQQHRPLLPHQQHQYLQADSPADIICKRTYRAYVMSPFAVRH